MAKWISLTHFDGAGATLTPGEVIDDRYFSLSQLRRAGAALVQYDEATQGDLRRAFLGQLSHPQGPKNMLPLLMSQGLVGVNGPNAEVLHIYCRSDGSDDNAGFSPDEAVATAGKAFSLIPKIVGEPVVVHFGDGAFDVEPGEGIPPWLPATTRSRVFVVGDGAGAAGSDGFTVVATGTVSSVSGQEFDPGVVLTDDQWAGLTLELTSGSAAGSKKSINWNTASTVRASGTTNVGTMANGDSYRVLRPATTLRYKSSPSPFAVGSGQAALARSSVQPDPGPVLVVVNVAIGFQPGETGFMFMPCGRSVLLHGVRTEPRVVFSGMAGSVNGGASFWFPLLDYSPIGSFAPDQAHLQWHAWGMQQDFDGADTLGGVWGYDDLFGYFNTNNVFPLRDGLLMGGRTQSIDLNEGARATLGSSDRLEVYGSDSAASIQVRNGARLINFSNLRIQNRGSGDGLRVEAGAVARCEPEECTSTSGYGIRVRNGGYCQVEGAFTGVVSGGAGDTIIDSNVQGAAAYTASGVGFHETPSGATLIRVD